MKKERIDKGLEYCNQMFDSFCAVKGIARHKKVTLTPQQNGLAERMNKIFIDKVKCYVNSS